MFLGRVVGTVWSTVKWPEVAGLKWLAVRPYTLGDLGGSAATVAPSHDVVVCADTMDAGVGDNVIIAYGHAARVALQDSLAADEKPAHPIDAAVVAIVDKIEVEAR